jgi:hypothetical protein
MTESVLTVSDQLSFVVPGLDVRTVLVYLGDLTLTILSRRVSRLIVGSVAFRVPAGAGIDVVFASKLLQTVALGFHGLDLGGHGLALAIEILSLLSPVYLVSFLVGRTKRLLSELLDARHQISELR